MGFHVMSRSHPLCINRGGRESLGGLSRHFMEEKKQTLKKEKQECMPRCNVGWVSGHTS
jgi:hypothetical protein